MSQQPVKPYKNGGEGLSDLHRLHYSDSSFHHSHGQIGAPAPSSRPAISTIFQMWCTQTSVNVHQTNTIYYSLDDLRTGH
ncbi:hypothetical protein Q1695_006831 [Nippostrongylus brasiliensis]|nr:hypothetical protein Q1695_006831 [Nippostrongylus brasiliensis]